MKLYTLHVLNLIQNESFVQVDLNQFKFQACLNYGFPILKKGYCLKVP